MTGNGYLMFNLLTGIAWPVRGSFCWHDAESSFRHNCRATVGTETLLLTIDTAMKTEMRAKIFNSQPMRLRRLETRGHSLVAIPPYLRCGGSSAMGATTFRKRLAAGCTEANIYAIEMPADVISPLLHSPKGAYV